MRFGGVTRRLPGGYPEVTRKLPGVLGTHMIAIVSLPCGVDCASKCNRVDILQRKHVRLPLRNAFLQHRIDLPQLKVNPGRALPERRCAAQAEERAIAHGTPTMGWRAAIGGTAEAAASLGPTSRT